MSEKPLSHQVKVVKVPAPRIHSNADSLEILDTLGFQTVVRKGEYKEGDLAYFICPDSIVPVREEYKFLWEGKVIPGEEPAMKYRRIRAVRLRKEYSEGLLVKCDSRAYQDNLDSYVSWGVKDMSGKWMDVQVGMDVSDILGVTHYQPPDPEDMKGQNERGPKRHLPKTFKGWCFYIYWNIIGRLGFSTSLQGSNEKGPKDGKVYYDIDNGKHHPNVFEEGEPVVVTEKLHGCQGKYVFQDGKMYAGSRNYWKSKNSTCVWRKTLTHNNWIEEWCRKNEGFTLYGEIVPVQGASFLYGCKPGELKFFVFDILKSDHTWVSKKDLFDLVPMYVSLDILGQWVPDLYHGPYSKEKMKELLDLKCILDKNTVKEGIVITSYDEQHVRGLGRKILKLISNSYLEKN